MRGLYAIVDVESLLARGVDPIRFGEAVLSANPAAVQLRDKRVSSRDTLVLLREIRPLATRAGVPLFANDRTDLALLSGCDGVHVGQEDLPVEAVRRLGRGLRVGVSTHTDEELARALEDEPDYIAIGPIFPTTSKQSPSPVVGLDALARRADIIRRAAPSTPIVAIGGITEANAPQVMRIVDMVAVIGALIQGADARTVIAGAATIAARWQTALRKESAAARPREEASP